MKIGECVGCPQWSGSTATVPHPTEFQGKDTTKIEVELVSVDKGEPADLRDLVAQLHRR